MKRRFISGLFMLLCLGMLVTTLTMPAEAALCKHEYVDTVCISCGKIGGTCGTKATWSFEPETGLLRITGSGTIPHYTLDFPAPWSRYRAEIKEVSVGASITQLGEYSFYECTNLTTINIPASITNIVTSAFLKCDSLKEFKLAEKANTPGSAIR